MGSKTLILIFFILIQIPIMGCEFNNYKKSFKKDYLEYLEDKYDKKPIVIHENTRRASVRNEYEYYIKGNIELLDSNIFQEREDASERLAKEDIIDIELFLPDQKNNLLSLEQKIRLNIILFEDKRIFYMKYTEENIFSMSKKSIDYSKTFSNSFIKRKKHISLSLYDNATKETKNTIATFTVKKGAWWPGMPFMPQ